MDFWMSDGSRSIHSVNRVKETFSGESKETERYNSLILPLTDSPYYIIPHGFGWRGFTDEIQDRYGRNKILSSMDSIFYYLCFHYGLILTAIIFILLIKFLLRKYRLLKNKSKVNFIILMLYFATAFLTQATIFAYITFSFSYAILLSQICEVKRSKTRIIIKRIKNGTRVIN